MNVDQLLAKCITLAFKKCRWSEHSHVTVPIAASRLEMIRNLLSMAITRYESMPVKDDLDRYCEMTVYETLPSVVSCMMSWNEWRGLVRDDDRGDRHLVKLYGRNLEVSHYLINPAGSMGEWLANRVLTGGVIPMRRDISNAPPLYQLFLEGRAAAIRNHLGREEERELLLTTTVQEYYDKMVNCDGGGGGGDGGGVIRLYEDKEDVFKYNMISTNIALLEGQHSYITCVAPLYAGNQYRPGCIIQKMEPNLYTLIFEDGRYYGCCNLRHHDSRLIDSMLITFKSILQKCNYNLT
jgi:hypothetical protein